MQPKKLLLVIGLCICIAQVKAQKQESTKQEGKATLSNIVKLNLSGLAFKNYSVQYERILKRKVSLALAVRTMPSSTLPFKNTIVKNISDDDPDAKNTLETFKLSNFAITPEVRFYLSKKGYGRGFYVAPFYRYASFKTNTLNFDYEGNGTSGSINLTGKLTANTVGLMFGSQWFLGEHVTLDWWIFGPHYGSGTGTFEGKSSRPLTSAEQQDLKQQLDDIDIPLTDKTVSVNANGASLKLSGPWGGIRAGLSLGIRF